MDVSNAAQTNSSVETNVSQLELTAAMTDHSKRLAVATLFIQLRSKLQTIVPLMQLNVVPHHKCQYSMLNQTSMVLALTQPVQMPRSSAQRLVKETQDYALPAALLKIAALKKASNGGQPQLENNNAQPVKRNAPFKSLPSFQALAIVAHLAKPTL